MARSSYPLTSSPLFRLLGKGQLQQALGVSWTDGARLLQPRYYRTWTKTTNGKARDIQQPLYELENLHKRIASLLSRIALPDYVYSRRTRSHVDNADRHRGAVPLVKTDINKFYPSVTWPMVYRMFRDRFECAEDISARLADLCCYLQKHLPTGSALSGYVAFFATQPLFDQLAALSDKHGCKITLYVDDLTISGSKASRALLAELRARIRYFGLRTRHSKSMAFRENQPKPVTGTVLIGERMVLPNRQHLKLWQAKRALASAAPADREATAKMLMGRVIQANQIVARQFATTHTASSDSVKQPLAQT